MSLDRRLSRLEVAWPIATDEPPSRPPMDWLRWERLLAELLETLGEAYAERLTLACRDRDNDPPAAHLLELCTDLVGAVYRNPAFARLALSPAIADLLLARPDSSLWPCRDCGLPLPYGKGPYRTAGGTLLEATVHLLPCCPACGGSCHGVSPDNQAW